MTPRAWALLFPVALLALQFGAAAVYAAQGNWRQVIYWLCACGIVTVVTW